MEQAAWPICNFVDIYRERTVPSRPRRPQSIPICRLMISYSPLIISSDAPIQYSQKNPRKRPPPLHPLAPRCAGPFDPLDSIIVAGAHRPTPK
ncbi:hypothetical protein CRG98_027874, partial [Punica granatum]